MSKVDKIFVVFKTHFDIGFTDLAEEVIKRYGSKMLPDVIETCEATRDFGEGKRFVWTMSAWPLLQSLDPRNASEENIRHAELLMEEGQIAWHALPYTTHTEFCGLEEYIRGLNFSGQLSRQFDKWPVSAKMTDVPGHTWILPSLLKKAGVEFLHLGCNAGCTPPEVPMLFFWEGPDGSRVLTFYSKGGYGSSLTPPADWPFPVWLALMHTGDNHGPQDPGVIAALLQEAEEEMPGTEVILGTLDDFYRELAKSIETNPASIPVIRKDLADSWIHGIGTYPDEVRRARALRHALTGTEKVLGLSLWNGLVQQERAASYKNVFDGIFEKSLLFGEHTWGLDVKINLGYDRRYRKTHFLEDKNKPVYKRMEQSWEEQRNRVAASEKELEAIRPEILNTIAADVRFDGKGIVVFNGLGWVRDGWVNLEKLELPGEFELTDQELQEPVAVETVQGRLSAYVRQLPALGYKTLTITAADRWPDPATQPTLQYDAAGGVLENRFYRLEADLQMGTLKSLVEKAAGKEWIRTDLPAGFGQYSYDIYGTADITNFIRTYGYQFFDWMVNDLGRMSYPTQEHLEFVPKSFTAEILPGTGHATMVLKSAVRDDSVSKYGNAPVVQLAVTLYDCQPYIDMEFKLQQKEETPFIEAGHLAFPLNLKAPKISVNKLGSVVDIAEDIIKNANNGLYCCENWVDVSDGENGFAVIPFATPLFSVGEKAIYQFAPEYVEREPVLYFNLFNNSWGTNFPQWMGGNFSFGFRLLPHRGDWREGRVWKHAAEVFAPVTAAKTGAGGNGSLPAAQELLKGLEGMELLAFKPAEDGKGLVLRLRELEGKGRNLGLEFTSPVDAIYRCDLLERRQELLVQEGSRLEFETKPFEIHSFYLEA